MALILMKECDRCGSTNLKPFTDIEGITRLYCRVCGSKGGRWWMQEYEEEEKKEEKDSTLL